MAATTDARAHHREDALIIAEYTASGESAHCLVRNISAGGLFVKTSWKHDVGQPITLTFPLTDADETITVAGTVARIEPTGFAVTFDQPIDKLACEKGQFPTIIHEGDR